MVYTFNLGYVGGSIKIQINIFMSHDSSSIEIEVYSDGKTLKLFKLLFFTYRYITN